MPYFFVDDGFSDSKEVLSIPARHRLAAVGLWTLCGAWSAGKLTNGEVPDEILKRFVKRPGVVDALIESTLWERTENGIRFTNWAKWQRTREQVISYRQWEADRKRAQRKRATSGQQVGANWEPTGAQVGSGDRDSWESDDSVDKPETSTDSEISHRDNHRDNENCPGGTPVTPVPVPITTHLSTDVALGRGSGGRASTATGHRLPDGWMPPQPVVAQMRSDHPHVNLKSEHEKFVDYWRAQPGAKGRKVDWPATWRNWIRRAAEQQTTRRNGNHRPTTDERVARLQAMKTPTDTKELE